MRDPWRKPVAACQASGRLSAPRKGHAAAFADTFQDQAQGSVISMFATMLLKFLHDKEHDGVDAFPDLYLLNEHIKECLNSYSSNAGTLS